jgi:hypothetical protein
MPCDEQYRAWAMRQGPADAPPEELHRAFLSQVTGCPGLTAQAVSGQAGGLTQPTAFHLAAAADLAISGVPVFIHRFFPGQETGQAKPGQQPIEPVRK